GGFDGDSCSIYGGLCQERQICVQICHTSGSCEPAQSGGSTRYVALAGPPAYEHHCFFAVNGYDSCTRTNGEICGTLYYYPESTDCTPPPQVSLGDQVSYLSSSVSGVCGSE